MSYVKLIYGINFKIDETLPLILELELGLDNHARQYNLVKLFAPHANNF